MQTSPIIGNLSTILSAIGTAGVILWRFNAWIHKHLGKIVTEQVRSGVQASLVPLSEELATHTKQIAALHQRVTQHQRQIVRLAWAGAETTASAAIWAKKVPSVREVELETQNWRNIVTNVDPDETAT